MSIERLIRPDLPEARATHLQEGFIMGGVIGEITSIDDLETIGRIKCRVPLFDESLDLPNNDDTYVHVLEEDTTPGVPGGSHRRLMVGSLCVLLPIMGDPRQMIFLGCLPNRVDRPHPELNRAKERTGSVSLNEVYNINDDSDQSKVESYPHGVNVFVSGKGDYEMKTLENARILLQQDSHLTIDNPLAVMDFAKDGQIVTTNIGKATSILKPDGEIKITNPYGNKIEMKKTINEITGPLSKVSEVLSKIQETLGGYISTAQSILEAAGQAVEQLGISGLSSAIAEVSNLVDDLAGGLGSVFEQGMGALEQLSGLTGDLTDTILPQIEQFTQGGLGDLASQVSNVLGNGINLDLAGELSTLTGLDSSKLESLINQFPFDTKSLKTSIFNEILPEGVRDVQSIFELGLDSNLDSILTTIESEGSLSSKLGDLQELWGDTAADFLSTDLLDSIAPVSPIEQLSSIIGNVQSAMGSSVLDSLGSVGDIISSIPDIQNILTGISTDEVDISKILEGVTGLDSKLGLGLSNLKLGGKTIAEWGQTDIGGTSLASVLGEFNIGSIDLTNLLVEPLLEQISSKINLSQWGIDESIDIKSLLSGIDLGTFNLQNITDKVADLINLEELPIANIFGTINALIAQNTDLSQLNLGMLLGGDLDELKDVELIKILKDSGANLAYFNGEDFSSLINLSEEVGLEEIISQSGLKVNLNDYKLGDLIGINLGSGITPPFIPESDLQLKAQASELGQQALETLFQDAIAPLTQNLKDALAKTVNPLNKLLDSIDEGKPGTMIHLMKELGEMKSQKGAKVLVREDLSQMRSANGRSTAYVSDDSSGFKTPWGDFSFGGRGGLFTTLGKMGLRALKKGGLSSGLLLDVAGSSLASFIAPDLDDDNEDNDPFDFVGKLAEVKVKDDQVTIRGGENNILVSSEGVFVNGIPIAFQDINNRLTLLETSVATLQAAATPPVTP